MLKIMTLNLNYYVAKHGPWGRRRELVRAAIEAAWPDAVAFQAVRREPAVEGGADQAAQLAALLPGMRHVNFRPAVEYADGCADGSAFLSRLPLGAVDHRPLTLLPGLEDTNHRLVLHARLDLPGGPLHLYNAHFSWVERQTRLNVAETLHYLEAGRLALLVGDLNAPAGENRLARLRQAGWIDAWEWLRPGDAGYTFESNAPSMRIDYAWASPELAPHLEAIELVARAEDEGGARASDHLGLLVTLDGGLAAA